MKKNILLLLTVAVAAVILFMTADIQSVEEYYNENPQAVTEDCQTVTLSVSCETILENYEELNDSVKKSGGVPENGVILPEGEYVLCSGDTVFDILDRALKYNKIHFDYTGGSQNKLDTVYIKGINNIYEYDCGSLSGWMYSVNGEFSRMECSDYVLSDGDKIEWVYTCDLGRDVGDSYYSVQGE